VGAAIAAGSQAERGIWALFVILANTSNNITTITSLVLVLLITLKLNMPVVIQIEMVNKIATSPNRLVRAVNILALNLLFLL